MPSRTISKYYYFHSDDIKKHTLPACGIWLVVRCWVARVRGEYCSNIYTVVESALCSLAVLQGVMEGRSRWLQIQGLIVEKARDHRSIPEMLPTLWRGWLIFSKNNYKCKLQRDKLTKPAAQHSLGNCTIAARWRYDESYDTRNSLGMARINEGDSRGKESRTWLDNRDDHIDIEVYHDMHA